MNQLTFWVLTQVPGEIGAFFGRLGDAHQAGLTAIAQQMTVSTAEAVETSRFLEALRALVSSGRCELQGLGLGTDHPVDPERFIGWQDENGIYLNFQLARNAVERLLGRDNLAGITNRALYQQLDYLGLILSKGSDGRPTIVKRVAGKAYRVLHLKPLVFQAG
jgi:hypothetical protein